MKKFCFLLLFMILGISAFSQTVSYAATKGGLWCDLIGLRAKVKALTGKALPYSAFEECKLMGLVKDSLSLESHPTDTLSYDIAKGLLIFDGKNLLITCDVASNTIEDISDRKPVYHRYTDGIGCCNCAGQNSTSLAVDSSIIANGKGARTADSAATAANSSSHQQNAHTKCCSCDYTNACGLSDLSRSSCVLQENCIEIEDKLCNFKGNDTLKSRWARVLPIIQKSFSDTTSENYGELARYLLCGSIDSLDIRPWKDVYVIANKNMWKTQEIWVGKEGYTVRYMTYDPAKPQKTLAEYDLHIAEKSHDVNLALHQAKMDSLPLCKMMAIDTGSFKINSLYRRVVIRRSDDFAKECTIFDEKRNKELFRISFDVQSATLCVTNVKRNRVLTSLSHSKQKDRKNIADIKETLTYL